MRQTFKIEVVVQVVSIGAMLPISRVTCQPTAPTFAEPGGSSVGVEKGFECWNAGSYNSNIGFQAEAKNSQI